MGKNPKDEKSMKEREKELRHKERALSDYEDQLDEKREELEESHMRLEEKRGELEEFEAFLEQEREELERAKERLSEREEKIRAGEEQIQGRMLSLQDREIGIEKAKKNLDRRRKDIEKEEKRLRHRSDAQDKRDTALNKRKSDLDRRLREVESREQEAEEDFQAFRLREEKKLRTELDELREARTKELDEELEKERRRRRKSLEEALAERKQEVEETLAERKQEVEEALAERKREVDSDLTERREKVGDLIATKTKELDERQQRLDERTEELDDRRETLKKERQQLVERENTLDMRRLRLESEEEYVAQRKANLDEEAKRLAAEKIADLEHKLDERQERVVGLQEELQLLQKRLDSYDDWRRRFGEQEPQEVLDRLKTLEQKLDEKREELRKRPTVEVKERLEELEDKRESWDKQRRELRRQLSEAKSKLQDLLLEAGAVEKQRDLYEAEKRRREALKTTVDALEDEVKRIKGIYDKPAERKARIGSIEAPVEALTDRLKNKRSDADVSELSWLEKIEESCAAIDFKVPTRLLYAFHTSLKTADASPITVLAGVSGTGKSMLPRVYSHFGGLQFLDVPVRPDWDSPQSLFGYFNSIDNQFNSTRLLRAMVQATKSPRDADYEGGFNDRMMLVLLDEMNLAHVELYFSDLLSKLESRRNSGTEKLPIELGAGVDHPYELELGDNVLWTGTMNQDATTKALSDKVVDRSNMIFFPRPDEFIRRFNNDLGDPGALLHKSTWKKWSTGQTPFADDQISDFKAGLEMVNGYLEKVGKALGHRVWQSVEQYMLNYPTVIEARAQLEAEAEDGDDAKAEQRDTSKLDQEMKKAFEDQVVQKVMPKLRGIETRGKARDECLDRIQDVLVDDLGLNLEKDFELACETGQGRFVWNSAHYIDSE